MIWLRSAWLRATALVKRRRLDADLEDEIAHHLAMREAERRAAGLSAEDARAAAAKQFGNAAYLKESSRDVWTFTTVENLLRDLAYGFRSLRRSPVFTSVTVLSLALGIGANAALFQLFDALRMRALPVEKAGELSEIRPRRGARSGSFQGPRPAVTYPIWQEIRRHQKAFSGVFAWSGEGFRLTRGENSRYVRGLWVSGELFSVLGVRPALGRLFDVSDDRPGCGASSVVLSHGFWRRELGGDPGVLGRTLTLEGRPFAVVGVAERRFFGIEVGRRFDVAVPLCADAALRGEATRLDKRWVWWLGVMGRRTAGVPEERAAAHLEAISPGVFEATIPSGYDADGVKGYLSLRLEAGPAGSGFSSLREDYASPLALLLGIAGLVLVLACANLANLMLARSGAREREIAVRLAIGASRGRIVSQLLTESLLLAAAGAALGALLASALSRLLVSLMSPADDPLFFDLGLDGRVLAFAACLAILTCALFGLAPALRSRGVAPAAAIASDGRSMTASHRRLASRRALLVLQVVLSLGLVVCAILFVRSLRNLFDVDPGFEPSGVRVATLDLSRLPPDAERRLLARRNVLERVRSLPGVAAAADATIVPLSGNGSGNIVYVGDGAARTKGPTNFAWVSPGYFSMLGMALRSGRDVDARDTAASPAVAVVNETFVKKLLNGTANPIGRRFFEPAGPSWPAMDYEIVGVVADSKYYDLREEPEVIAFLPVAQQTSANATAYILLRSAEPLPGLLSGVRRAAADAAPGVHVELADFSSLIADTLRGDRLMTILAGIFGFLAAVLACVGVYGLTAYSVAGRRTEFAIRVALGALPRNVAWLVLRETILVVLGGIAIGIPVTIIAAQLLSNLLFGLSPTDTLSLVAATLLLLAAAALAGYIPARRVARVDPVAALRGE